MTKGKITIFFNGEIYNYKNLKSELISQNVNFDTNGDTEVILNGYRKHGLNFLKKLVGMFSIVIIDRYLNKAIVLRDPIGIKPLYIHKNKNFIGISSEVKPLLRACKPRVDVEALKELLVFGFAAGKFSNYKDIDLLKPGTLLEINLKNSFIKEQTYENIFDYNKIYHPDNLEIGELIDESIQDHTMSDVGYSLQLSGGVDSSYIAAVCAEKSEKKLKAFSICVDDENLNEEKFQKIVTQKYNLDHYKVNFTGRNYAEELPSTVIHMEGPTPHGGCVALKFLNKEIAKSSKVVLTGEGADELFGGYRRYKDLEYFRFIRFIKKFIPQNLIPNIYPFKTLNKYKSVDPIIFSSVNFSFENLWSAMPEIIPLPGHRDKISSKFSDILDKLRSVDQSSYLSSLLMRQDKLSMAHSVEARVPYTHLPLYKRINSLKINSSYFKKQTKPILKQIAKKKLPSELIFRKKNGLLAPFGKWLSDLNGAGAYLDYLDNSESQIKSYVDEKRFKKFLLETKKDMNKNQSILRKLIEIELWMRSIKLPDGELLNK